MNLNGKRVVVTRPRAQAEEFANALSAAGAWVIFLPVIEIVPPSDFFDLDFALQNINSYDWLIFTSVHGVDAFFGRLNELRTDIAWQHLQIVAIGPKTTQRLLVHGIIPDLVPEEYVAEAIFTAFGNEISGKRFLLPQSDLARDVLAKELREAGGFVDEVVAYRNVPAPPTPGALKALRSGVDIVTFTSPSTVRNFIMIVQQNGFDPLHLPGNPIFACIGPITKEAAEEAGLPGLVTAGEYTTAGLIDVLTKLVYS